MATGDVARPKPAVDPVVLERFRKESRAVREQYAHKPTWEEVVGPEGVRNAAPFYFELLAGVGQLKAARLAAGLTIPELAAKADLSADDVERLETGRLVNPSWQMLGRYAVAVGRILRLTAE